MGFCNDFIKKTDTWTYGTDFINFGFSGSARGKIKMAEYLVSVDCSVFVCNYDYNATDPDFFEKTHYNFYKAYRNKRKTTPIILISNRDTDENFAQAKERLKVIKKTYETALKERDKNVYFIDGKMLCGKADRENCTVDGTYPNDLGFYNIAKRIYRVIKRII